MLYIGLMSGTSADAIDAALVELNDHQPRLVATHSRDYSPGIKDSIESIILSYPAVDGNKIQQLHHALGVDFAVAAEELLKQAGPEARVAAIGSHGQTVYHGPGDVPPVTVQLGDPQVVADRTGLTTVGNFRSNDLREGGQGAPLAPGFHNEVFRDDTTDRLILNLGGIANLTRLPADAGEPVVGFDTGPASTLMDQWCRIHRGQAFDTGGRWAAKGRVLEPFVEALLGDAYFDVPPPKSTGREYFNLSWMKNRFPGWGDEAAVDIQASLLEVTARSVALGARSLETGPYELYACGGGAHNTALMNRLDALTGGNAMTTDALGIPPDWVEACTFAWLAYRRLQGLPGNLPTVTGAGRAVVLGEVFTPA